MENIDDVIKRFNLFFANTLENSEINCERSISLFDLIEKFNKLYLSFMKDYYELDKLELGKFINVIEFFKNNAGSYRELLLYVHETDQFLHLIDEGNNVSVYSSNSMNLFDKRHYEKVNLEKDKVKQMIDLFDKYKLLLELFEYMKNSMIYGDGTHTLISNIGSNHGDVLNGLNTFTFNLGISSRDACARITLCVNLGDNLSINNSKSMIDFYGLNIKCDENDYIKLIKNIYIDKKYLNSSNEKDNYNNFSKTL